MPWTPTSYQTMLEAEFAAGQIAKSDQGKRIGSNLENLNARTVTVEGAQRADALAVIPRELPPFGMAVTPEWFWKMPVVNGILGKQGVGGETFIDGGLLVPRSDSNYAWALFASKTGKVKVGSYVGDGSVGHAITGVGFQPDALIIWENGSEANGVFGFFTTKDAIAQSGGILTTQFRVAPGANKSGDIQSLDADGFSLNVPTPPNTNGVTYNYVAFKDAISDPTLKIDIGTYTGDGVGAGQIISGLGFTPQLVLTTINVNQNGGSYIVSSCRSHETASGSETHAFGLRGAVPGDVAGVVQPLRIESDGFKVRGISDGGSENQQHSMNINAKQYLYVALKGGAITM